MLSLSSENKQQLFTRGFFFLSLRNWESLSLAFVKESCQKYSDFLQETNDGDLLNPVLPGFPIFLKDSSPNESIVAMG